jgi:perosamine synthetase
MRIGRTLSPAAAPLSVIDLFNGIGGIISPEKAINALKLSICQKFNKKHCFLLSSGKAAITLTLKALAELAPERNEVIIPAFNCYSVPSAIARAGLIVRPCEIDPVTLQFQDESLLSILKSSTKILAIMPTHLFGLPADIEHVRTLTNNSAITIIEDAAQAMGSEYNGKFLGTAGDVGIFSLARGKALSAGEGGIILTDSDLLAEKISHQVSQFPEYSVSQLVNLAIKSIALTMLIHPLLFWIPKMMPFLKLGETVYDPDFPIRNFSGFQAGLAKNWTSKISWLLKERAKRVTLYSQHLSGITGISILTDNWNNENLACIRYPLIIKDTEIVKAILYQSEKMGLGISKTYPDSVDTIPQITGEYKTTCALAHKVVNTLITLPCHPMVRERDILKIVEVIRMRTLPHPNNENKGVNRQDFLVNTITAL